MKIIIVTLENGFFGSAGESWLSLDTNLFLKKFKEAGFAVEVTEFSNVLSRDLKCEDVVIYTSSEIPEVREFIKDFAFVLDSKCNIVPSLRNLLAHENKGFQQLIRSEWEDDILSGRYVYDIDQLPRQVYPYVVKDVTGAGGAKVRLISSKYQIAVWRIWNNIARWHRILKHLIRKITLTKEQYKIYNYRYKVFRRLVQQEYIPGAAFDFKVLVFAKKFFVVRREVRKGDFRASGSGRLSFPEDCDRQLLDYCKVIFDRLDTPIASLDVLVNDGCCFLIEYQTTNFGPTALRDSNGYYSMNTDGSWGFTKAKSDLHSEFASALVSFVQESYVIKSKVAEQNV